jgi:gliding motility-associated-like protein
VGKDEVNVTVVDLPKVDLGSDQEICEGDKATFTISDSKASYSWSTNEKEITISVGTSQAVVLTQYYDVLCQVKDTLNVIVIQYPISALGNDTTVCFVETSTGTLTLDAGAFAESYLWSDGSTNSTLSITAKGAYSVSLTNGKSCTISDEIVVNELCETTLFFPSAFTPNNDGTNDLFSVQGANVVDFQLNIFNRWGEVIYTSYNINDQWDGKVNGNIVQQDVYIVKVRYRVNEEWGSTSTMEQVGTLAIIR